MRFEFYSAALDAVPKLSVDGTVDNSIHFSHWEGNRTPVELKADTSTEIALNLVASPQQKHFTEGIELVTNNHFDTDGTLSIWTVLNGARALPLREILIGAAEAGDFSEINNADGVKVSIAIQGAEQAGSMNEDVSPLARHLAPNEEIDDARSYELVLPEVERLLTNVDDYEPLWRDGWEHIVQSMKSFESGKSSVEEFKETRLSLIRLAPEIFSPAGFDPTRHSAPFTAISHFARGHLFLIASAIEEGWVYRIDYPYYSWADTVVRPKIARRDFSSLLDQLNQLEPRSDGAWKSDTSEMTSAVKYLNEAGGLARSALAPEVVAEALNSTLIGQAGLSASRAGS